MPFAVKSLSAAVALSCLTLATTAQAQQKPVPYPTKPVKMIVASEPGGGSDIMARRITEKLTQKFGQSFVVENHGGAGGMIGYDLAAKAPGDGYTLLMGTSSGVNNAGISAKVKFDPLKAFAAVAQCTSSIQIAAVNPALPVRNIKELIDYARKNPGKVNFASSGVGGTAHLMGEALKAAADFPMQHIAYRGIGPGLLDTVAGTTQVVFSSPGSMSPHVKSGKLRAIGVSGKERSPAYPDVPTFSESGVPGFTWVGWFGILTTGGTPRSTILTLNQAINEALKSPEVHKILVADGSDPVIGTPEDLYETMKTSLEQASKIVKSLNLKLD